MTKNKLLVTSLALVSTIAFYPTQKKYYKKSKNKISFKKLVSQHETKETRNKITHTPNNKRKINRYNNNQIDHYDPIREKEDVEWINNMWDEYLHSTIFEELNINEEVIVKYDKLKDKLKHITNPIVENIIDGIDVDFNMNELVKAYQQFDTQKKRIFSEEIIKTINERYIDRFNEMFSHYTLLNKKIDHF